MTETLTVTSSVLLRRDLFDNFVNNLFYFVNSVVDYSSFFACFFEKNFFFLFSLRLSCGF